MKTDDLVDLLSANFEAADRGKAWRAVAGALAVGAAVAFGAMLAALGMRADAFNVAPRAFVWIKLLFTLSVIALATIFLIKFARPLAEKSRTLPLLALPFAAIAVGAIFVLMSAHATTWDEMILGKEWLTCLVSIPLFAVAPFAALVWVLRKTAAPTDLGRAGAVVGLVAGGIGATAYAFHCPDDSLPFVAVWYGTTIALCTFIGARLGPRVLRW